jgi:hypothetical protein
MDMDSSYDAMGVVGTCNGLVCLCDHGGNITVANPVTRRALHVPPPFTADRVKCFSWSRHEAYSFAYHVSSSATEKTEVWVMEGATTGGQEIGWSLWYVMQVSRGRSSSMASTS